MSFTRTTLIASVSALLIPAGIGMAQAQKQRTGTAHRAILPQADQRFIMQAAKDGAAEVDLAAMAVERGTNPQVKELAQRLLEDHSKSNSDLQDLAGQKGVTLPTAFPKSAIYNKLSKMTGAAFDREWVRQVIADHEKDIATFERQAKAGTDSDVKAFAAATLPVLRAHLEQARAIKL